MVKGSTTVAKKAISKTPQKLKVDRTQVERSQKAKPVKESSQKTVPVTEKKVAPNMTVTIPKETVALPVQTSETALLKLKISKSLYAKLKRTAQDESLAIDDLAAELLTEGVVLRAWEIIERKAAMRSENGNHAGGGHQRGNGNNFHRNNNNHHKRNNNNSGGRRMGAQGGGGFNNTVMDDRANFMEYVRNQDPNRR